MGAVQNLMTGGKPKPNAPTTADDAIAGMGGASVEEDGVAAPEDALFWHGRLYAGPLEPPTRTWHCAEPPRKDHDAPRWLTASEFDDTPAAATAKAAKFADLLR